MDDKKFNEYKKKHMVISKKSVSTGIACASALVILGGLTAGHFAYKATHHKEDVPVVVDQYVVNFNTNGGNEIEPIIVKKGETITKPTDPSYDDYHSFKGWYTDQSCQTEFDFTKPIDKNITIYAKWGLLESTEGLKFEVLDEGEKTCKVSVEDKMLIKPVFKIPSKYNINGTDYTVTQITDQSFQNCKTLVEIELPDSLYLIDSNSFMNCSNLKRINLSDNITHIGSNAFGNCTSLIYAYIPKQLGSEILQEGVFRKCVSLESVDFSEESTLRYIYPYAFENCTKLKKIQIPKTIEEIGNSAFANCFSLEEVIYQDGSNLKVIDEQGFRYCSSLKTIKIPNTKDIIMINSFAFSECTSLEKVEVGDKNLGILSSVFLGCESLESFIIPKNSEIVSLGEFSSFGRCGLKSFYFTSKIQNIGYSAFTECSKIEEITIDSENVSNNINLCLSQSDILNNSTLTTVKVKTGLQVCSDITDVFTQKTTEGEYDIYRKPESVLKI